mgnify:CR=1 FL=1
MNRIRYIPSDLKSYSRLTPYKVYDVLCFSDVIHSNNIPDSIVITNDDGEVEHFFTHSDDDVLEFIEVTIEFRNEVIDEILE